MLVTDFADEAIETDGTSLQGASGAHATSAFDCSLLMNCTRDASRAKKCLNHRSSASPKNSSSTKMAYQKWFPFLRRNAEEMNKNLGNDKRASSGVGSEFRFERRRNRIKRVSFFAGHASVSTALMQSSTIFSAPRISERFDLRFRVPLVSVLLRVNGCERQSAVADSRLRGEERHR